MRRELVVSVSHELLLSRVCRSIRGVARAGGRARRSSGNRRGTQSVALATRTDGEGHSEVSYVRCASRCVATVVVAHPSMPSRNFIGSVKFEISIPQTVAKKGNLPVLGNNNQGKKARNGIGSSRPSRTSQAQCDALRCTHPTDGHGRDCGKPVSRRLPCRLGRTWCDYSPKALVLVGRAIRLSLSRNSPVESTFSRIPRL